MGSCNIIVKKKKNSGYEPWKDIFPVFFHKRDFWPNAIKYLRMCCLLFNIKYLFMCYFYNLSKYFKNLEINPNLVSNHLLKSIWDHFSTFLMLTGHIKLHLDKCSEWNIWIITFLCFDKCSFTYVRQRITSWKINELWHIKSIFFPLIFLSVFLAWILKYRRMLSWIPNIIMCF